MAQPRFLLKELAELLKAQLHGDPDSVITGVMTLQDAQLGQISFLDNLHYLKQLRQTRASAVILQAEHLPQCPAHALLVKNPYYSFALVARLFEQPDEFIPGIHPTAVIGNNCEIHPEACVDACAVIHSNVILKERVRIGPHCMIGERVVIGADSRLYANVTLYTDTQIGERVTIHGGTVIGSDGFGFAQHQGAWYKIPQLGRVLIGNDVEIGANVTIDRGSLGDTVLAEGVKLDNQIQIGHNVQIDAHTIIAGCTGIAGSTRIGKNCRIGGGVCINGHLEIADAVSITGMSGVSRSIRRSGVYASSVPVQPYSQWRRNTVRLRQLDDMARRVKKIEQKQEENIP